MVRQVRLLGEVSAVTDHGEPADIGPAKCQALLAALALAAGKAVPVWRLTELIWGTEPPRTAERTLQSYATRLRKGLGPGSVVRAGAAYRLDVAAEAVDVIRFQRRLDAGDVEAALAEWTGPPLGGLTVPGLAAMAAGLTEQWLAAVEADLARRVQAGAPDVIGRLTELTAVHPYREGLWALLMTALYRAGRQSDALAAYRTARQHLIEHLGVEPGPALRELESLVLGQDERLLAGRAARPTGTVTFGFCEVADQGRWWATRRPEMAAAMVRHDALVRACVDRHDGYVFAGGGEEFGAAFHRAADAAAWAADLQAAVRAEPWPGGVGIRLRIGLHTGETEEREQGYYGPAVNVAARLAAAGNGGQTLVSGITADLLDQAGLRELGTYRLEGAPRRIFQAGDDEHPPLRTEDNRRGNLPRRLGRLVGRDTMLEAIDQALAAAPVVTLVGPGGIGKTRLAVAAAARRADPDGAWLIELAEITSPDDVLWAVASLLGIRENPGQALSQSVVTALRTRRALLVLDNCEHVIDTAAGLARAIVTGCPDVQVLATSREGLGLDQGHERLVAVTPLEPAGPGAELFLERAPAVAVDVRADRPAVEEICRRLDGVPLAIELAAARTASLAPADLLARLDDHLRLLVGGPRTGAARHRTLRATIKWSYDLLSPAEQRLFRQLSVFAGPFGLAAAVAVGATRDVDELLGNLVTRSMVIVEPGPFGRRFRLLETMRQFAAERLASAGETSLAAERHARWCLDEVTMIRELLAGQAEVEGVARLDELWPNLRAAFEWACAAKDRDFAYALVRSVVVEVNRRSRAEIGDWVERVLALAPPGEDLIAFGLSWAAERYKLSQDSDAYERLAERYGEPDHPLVRHARAAVYEDYEGLARWAAPAVAVLRERGENDLADQLELDVGGGLLLTGRFAEHDAIVAALADRYRAQGPPTLLNLTLVMQGYSASLRGKHDRASELFDAAISVAVPPRTNSPYLAIAARAVFDRGDRARGFRMLGAYIEQLLDDGNMQASCVSSLEFTNMMAAVGRLADAARMLGFVETTGILDGAGWRTTVEAAERAIGTGFGSERAWGKSLSDRQALEYMLAVLRQPLPGGAPDSSAGDLGAEQVQLLEHGRVGEGEQVQLAGGG
jgi:predicted ATPase/DNA-binding SARP family transcriptional activator